MLRAAVSPIALAAVLATAAPVAAQTVDEEGALTLQTQIKAIVGQYLLPPSEAVDYRMDGAVQMMPTGDRYEGSLPAITVVLDRDAELAIPPIPLTVTPQANGWNLASWRLPDVFTIANPNGPERVDITLGRQSGEMLVAPAYQSVMATDFVLGDLAVVTDELPGTATLGEIALTGDYAEIGTDTFDFTSDYRLTDLLVDLQEVEGVRVALGSAALTGAIDSLRMDLLSTLAPFGQGMMAAEPDAAAFAQLQSAIDAAGPGAWLTGLSMGVALDDFDLITEDGSGRLDGGELTVAFDGLDTDQATLSAGFAMEGLTTSDLPPEYLPAIPTTARLSLALQNLPAGQLGNTARNFIATAAMAGPDDAMGMAMFELMGLAMAGNPALAIERLYLEAPLGYVSGTARATPNMQSALGAVGTASVTVGGLQDMIAFLQSGTVPDGEDMAVALTVIGAMGRDDTDSAGDPVKIFDLEFTADGTILLNGNDMGPILNQL